MALTSCSSAVVHPLLRVLTDSSETLRKDAADTICALALALGPDLALFAPAIRKVTCWQTMAACVRLRPCPACVMSACSSRAKKASVMSHVAIHAEVARKSADALA